MIFRDMGALNLKGTVLQNKRMTCSYSTGSLWKRVKDGQGTKVKQGRKWVDGRRTVMKRRRPISACRDGSRRRSDTKNGISRRVTTLKRLIPSCDSSNGLEELFRDTVDYIISLQTKVREMRVMVDMLSSCGDHE